MWQWHEAPDGWGLFWMILMMGLFWFPILLLILWGIRGFPGSSGRNDSPPPASRSADGQAGPDAREIACRAYAWGDIGRQQFLQLIEDLDHTEQARTP